MPAKIHGVDHWDTYCLSDECRQGQDQKKLNTEPMQAAETIALRDNHNKIFHKSNKLAQATAHILYNVRCVDCGTGGGAYEITLRPVEQGQAEELRDAHNLAMHEGKG